MKDLKKDIVRRALLLDYYGALLTEKQRQIYDLYFQEDLTEVFSSYIFLSYPCFNFQESLLLLQ